MKKKKFLLLSLIPLSLIMLGACKEKNDNNKVEDITSTIEDKDDTPLSYTVDDEYATIWGLSDEGLDLTEITIPSRIYFDGFDYEVGEIGPAAFKDNTKITVVNIPTTVRYIKYDAFSGCTNLKEVNFIDENGNKSTEIDKKAALKEIEERAFANTKIEKFVFPKKLEYVRVDAFYNTNLKSLTFYGQDARRVFGVNAFYNTKLENVSDEANRIKLENGLLIDDYSLIYADINLEEINLPENITTISDGALSYSCLKKINLNNVKYIYTSAFKGSAIEQIDGGDLVEYVAYDAFASTNAIINNNKKLIIGSVLAFDSIDTDTYVVDENIKSISYVSGSAKNIIIKSNVESIGAYAFSDVSGLEKAYFQSVYGTTLIDSKSFKDSVNLIIPNNTDRYYKENNKSVADRFTTENINITFYKNDEKISTVSIPYGSFLSEYIPNGYKSVKDKDGNVYNKGNMLFFIEDTDLYLYESDITLELRNK